MLYSLAYFLFWKSILTGGITMVETSEIILVVAARDIASQNVKSMLDEIASGNQFASLTFIVNSLRSARGDGPGAALYVGRPGIELPEESFTHRLRLRGHLAHSEETAREKFAEKLGGLQEFIPMETMENETGVLYAVIYHPDTVYLIPTCNVVHKDWYNKPSRIYKEVLPAAGAGLF